VNPYNAPKSELATPRGPAPVKIKIILFLVAVAGVSAFTHTYLYLRIDESTFIDDPFSLGINVFWLCVLLWVANSVARGRENPKAIFLVLAVMTFGFAILDYQGTCLLVLSLIESLSFALGYLLLRAQSLRSWYIDEAAKSL